MPHTQQPHSTRRHPYHNRETFYEYLRSQRRISLQRWLVAHTYDLLMLLREAYIPLVGFIVVMLSGALYMKQTYHGADAGYTWGDAFFQTMRMLALEHDELYPHDILGQILFFAIPIFGLGFVFQGVLDFGRLLLDKNSRLDDWQIALARTYENHFIICGLGSVSYRVVLQLLKSGHEVVAIEQDWEGDFVQAMLGLRVPVIHGDARNRQVLERAGLLRARGLVTATSDDMLNIKMALEAQRVRPDIHVVLRIFNEDLDNHLERSQFGPNTAFSSSALAAPTMAAAAVCRGIKYALPLHEELLGLTELTIKAGGHLENSVHALEAALGVQVVGYWRPGEPGSKPQEHQGWHLHIGPETRLQAHDQVLLLGSLPAIGAAWQHGTTCQEIIATLGSDIQQHLTRHYNTVIVCGLGTVGYRVVKELYQMRPRPEIVVICDELTRDTFLEEIEALGIRLIKGDARAARVLRLAGIARAYSVVAVTSDKLTNVQICLAARHIRGDLDLVLRVFSDVLAEQLEGMFGLQTTYSTAVLAATTLAAAVVVKGTDYAVDVGERLMSTVRWKVQPGDEFDGHTIYSLRQQRGIVLVSLRRGSKLLLPGANSRTLSAQPLQADDEIILLAEIHTIAQLRSHSTQSALADARATRPLLSAPLVPYWSTRFDEQNGLTWALADVPAAAQGTPARNGSKAANAHAAAENENLLKQLLQREPERKAPS